MATIVVGVDGSRGSVDALRFAIDEARVRGAEVKAVSAWTVPVHAYRVGWSVPVDVESFRELARSALDRSLEEAGAAGSGVAVTPVVAQGHAPSVLCHEAREADLLVVGSRGLGGFRGLLLGSVSQQTAQHAPCPIVIIPSNEVDTDDGGTEAD